MMPLYAVQTERFGEVTLTAPNVGAARATARKRFKAGPAAVRRVWRYRLCEACECSPCMCDHK